MMYLACRRNMLLSSAAGENMPRQSPFIIDMSPVERASLESVSRRYSAPYRDVVRARIVLLAAQGQENTEISRRLDIPVQIVSKWRKRFFEERLAGLAERSRTGRRPAVGRPRSSRSPVLTSHRDHYHALRHVAQPGARDLLRALQQRGVLVKPDHGRGGRESATARGPKMRAGDTQPSKADRGRARDGEQLAHDAMNARDTR